MSTPEHCGTALGRHGDDLVVPGTVRQYHHGCLDIVEVAVACGQCEVELRLHGLAPGQHEAAQSFEEGVHPVAEHVGRLGEEGLHSDVAFEETYRVEQSLARHDGVYHHQNPAAAPVRGPALDVQTHRHVPRVRLRHCQAHR